MNNAHYQVPNQTNTPRQNALHYMAPLVDVARESFLILDPDLRVLLANPQFYKDFQVSSAQTENELVYELGNGQWNILALRKLLENILPKKTIIKDYEVFHVFPKIGKKTILLNARKLDDSQLIILAMEDITIKKMAVEKLANYTKGLETQVDNRTLELKTRIEELESLNQTMIGRELKMVELKKVIVELKKQLKNCHNKNSRNSRSKNGNGQH